MFLRAIRRVLPDNGSASHAWIAPNADIRYAKISFERAYFIGENSKISGELRLGNATTIGRSNHIFGDVTIGRYCQLAPCVGIYATNHPLTHASTYVNSHLFAGRLKQWQEAKPVVIGNDVWIGHGAVILAGVTIGDGSIIGAGSVVTKDVPGFTIAVGNPVRVLRERFPTEVALALGKLKWWNLSERQLAELEELFHIDLSAEPEKGLQYIAAFTTREGLREKETVPAVVRQVLSGYPVIGQGSN